MTPSAQVLYFHLCMKADDDGIVEAYTVMKIINSSEDDFRALVGRQFVKPLNEDLVSVILDWNEHNLIRADRKVNSIYKDLLVKILPDIKIITPKTRADTGKITAENKGINSMDVQWTADGPHRLGKVRLGKDNNLVAERDDRPYSFQEELEKMRDSKRKDFKIIALYWKKKNWVFENREQFNSALKRELKASKALKGYTGEQIGKAIGYCAKEYPDIYTLETVHKRITDVVNKKPL